MTGAAVSRRPSWRLAGRDSARTTPSKARRAAKKVDEDHQAEARRHAEAERRERQAKEREERQREPRARQERDDPQASGTGERHRPYSTNQREAHEQEAALRK